MTDIIKVASQGVSLVSEIMKAAGDNPQVKEAGSNLGKTALTITKTINNALLPLAAVNFAFDKARKYFDEKFAAELSDKVAAIPLESIVEPKASIAGPALQGLAFTHEEPNLKNMYLSLLATAMDGRVASAAHPAFVEVIKQLTADEANKIAIILRENAYRPIIQIGTADKTSTSWTLITNHLMNFRNKEGAEIVPGLDVMVDNWLRLGLVHVSYTSRIVADGAYDWIESRFEFREAKELHQTDSKVIKSVHGYIARTAFGEQFAKAVGLMS